MVEKLVVIGGDAAGMSAAAQARRLKDAGVLDITVLEQGPEVSYSACGIPYWVGDQVSDRDALIARVPRWTAISLPSNQDGTLAINLSRSLTWSPTQYGIPQAE